MKIGSIFWALSVLILVTRSLVAEEPVDYLADVKSILRERCYACHGALKQESGLRLDTARLMRRGGDSGPAIEPGDAGASLLLEKVSEPDESLRMPPEGKPLTADEIAHLKAWIIQGARAPADEQPQEDSRKHWAFVSPVRPAVPRHDAGEADGNPIDAFLADALRERGLTPVPVAARHVLLRRVYMDLIGLAPSRDELWVFLSNTSGDTYERIVDRLLASPHYGERWGRHWMDVWRYADHFGIFGGARGVSKKHIWRWRDWIVESLNEDKPYDRMIVEMLAADEIAPADRGTLRATGFVARNYYFLNRNTWLDGIVEHTGKAFLGLMLNCCRCHDHKYDPIAQREYYQMRSFFEPHRVRHDCVPGQPDVKKDGLPRVFDANLEVPTYLFVSGNEKNPDLAHPISPGVPEYLSFAELDLKPIRLPGEAYYPALRDFAVREMLAEAQEVVSKAATAYESARNKGGESNAHPIPDDAAQKASRPDSLQIAKKRLANASARLVGLEARIAAERARHVTNSPDAEALARAASVAHQDSDVMQAELAVMECEAMLADAMDQLLAGDPKAKVRVVAEEWNLAEASNRLMAAQRAKAEGDVSYPYLGRIYPNTSSGRRAALARWITDPRHPLTARVAVNHVWLRHFGQPLVPTVFNFGRSGKPPSNPQLLDYLAVEFMRRGWNMKWLHRLIVTSAAYRRSSSNRWADAHTLATDPENRYFWRMNPRRMESQIIRDNVLHLTRVLDQRIGGPTIDPDQADSMPRRSIYFQHSSNARIEFLTLFDDASVEECYRRVESIVPQQALAMANSKFVLDGSRQLAQRLLESLGNPATVASDPSGPSDVQFIVAAFETVLSRGPTVAEQEKCVQGLDEMQQSLAERKQNNPSQRAREYLVHVLLNHNDFLTIR